MTFVTAWLAAAGLAAMAVPILIHLLLRRRREPVPWAAMRLLRKAMREQSRRLRLEQIVVLALRCLLLAALGAAVAQPLLRAGGLLERRDGGRAIFLIIDDGILSGLHDETDGTALDIQKARADAILQSLQPGDTVGLIAAAQPARGLVVPPTGDISAVKGLIARLEPSDAPSDLPGAITTLREALERVPEDRTSAVFLLSEFRQGSAALDEPLPTLLESTEGAAGEGAAGLAGRRIEFLAAPVAETVIDNVQVASIEPLRRLLLPGQSDGSGQVTVRLRRFGELPAAISRVQASGVGVRPQAPREVRWEAGRSEVSTEFLLEPGDATPEEDASSTRGALGAIISTERDPLPADDRRGVVLQARQVVKVALLDRRSFGAEVSAERLSSGQWMARALRPSEVAPLEVVVEDPTRLDERALRGIDVAVVARPDLLGDDGWTALRGMIARGGMVVVVPPEELRVHGWIDRMTTHLRVPWRVELEAVDTAEGLALAEVQPPGPLLRLLESELPELVAPVRVFRRLPIDASAAPSDVVLVAADGSPLVVAASPRGPAGPSGGAGGSVAGSTAGGVNAGGEPLAGQLVLFGMATELAWTDLPTKPAMVPIIQELVRQGVGLGARGSDALVGERLLLGPSASELLPLSSRRRSSMTEALSNPCCTAWSMHFCGSSQSDESSGAGAKRTGALPRPSPSGPNALICRRQSVFNSAML